MLYTTLALLDMSDECIGVLQLIGFIIEQFKILYTSLWNFDLSRLEIVNTAITSAAVSLTTLFFTMEAFSQMAQFRFERIEDAIRLGLKFVVAKVIIENTSNIIGGIYQFLGKSLGSANMVMAMNKLQTTIEGYFDMSRYLSDAVNTPLGVGTVFLYLFLILYVLVTFIMFTLVTVQIVGVIFEILAHQAVGPIAISTLCNDTARSTGISFIKSYAAACLQFTVIGAMFNAFAGLLETMSNWSLGENIVNAGMFAGFFTALMPLICMIVLCVSIGKAGEMTKRMFGA